MAIIEKTREASSRTVRVAADSDRELVTTYKALMQYRTRHPELKIGIRKRADCIHVWLDERHGEL